MGPPRYRDLHSTVGGHSPFEFWSQGAEGQERSWCTGVHGTVVLVDKRIPCLSGQGPSEGGRGYPAVLISVVSHCLPSFKSYWITRSTSVLLVWCKHAEIIVAKYRESLTCACRAAR